MRRPTAKDGRRGIALVIVLMVVTILTVLVLEFHLSTRVDLRISANIADDLRAFYLAKSGVNVAGQYLLEDAEDNNVDHLGEDWAQELPPVPVGDAYVIVRMQDEYARLNVNRLLRSSGRPNTIVQDTLTQLCQILGLDPVLVEAMIDWMDEDNEHFVTGGYEDTVYGYGTDAMPYPSKNAPLDTAPELNLIAGMNNEVYKILSPYLSIHSSSRVNINTADVNLLKALILAIDPTADEGLANQIVEYRTEEPFTRSSMRRVLRNQLGFPSIIASRMRRYCTTSSSVFRVTSTATVNNAVRTVTAVVKRGRGDINILYWRSGG